MSAEAGLGTSEQPGRTVALAQPHPCSWAAPSQHRMRPRLGLVWVPCGALGGLALFTALFEAA